MSSVNPKKVSGLNKYIHFFNLVRRTLFIWFSFHLWFVAVEFHKKNIRTTFCSVEVAGNSKTAVKKVFLLRALLHPKLIISGV